MAIWTDAIWDKYTILPDDMDPEELGLIYFSICFGDTDESGTVDVEDLLRVLNEYGSCLDDCLGDLDNSGAVDIEDILILIGGWGECP